MPGITPRLRSQVLERDGYLCLGCGQDVTHMRWYSIQHRKARGGGGRNELTNLVTLCGSATSQGCHLLCEQRDSEMRARGLWVSQWDEPRDIPVILWNGKAVRLLDDGTYQET